MQKTVCYFMTRNIYRNVLPSLKSLLKNGNIDNVILMTEDDDVGFGLPANVSVKNISGWKRLLDPDGPNYRCRWSYMVMMKVVLSKIFRRSRILSLDVDTIVTGDISGLWDLDLDGYYGAAAREWYWTNKYGYQCINAGVIMWNLDMMRDGMTEKLIRALNTKKYNFPEQDAISEICRDRIRVIDSAYNCTEWTDPTLNEPKIIHYAAYKERFFDQPLVKEYQAMSWTEVMKA